MMSKCIPQVGCHFVKISAALSNGKPRTYFTYTQELSQPLERNPEYLTAKQAFEKCLRSGKCKNAQKYKYLLRYLYLQGPLFCTWLNINVLIKMNYAWHTLQSLGSVQSTYLFTYLLLLLTKNSVNRQVKNIVHIIDHNNSQWRDNKSMSEKVAIINRCKGLLRVLRIQSPTNNPKITLQLFLL